MFTTAHSQLVSSVPYPSHFVSSLLQNSSYDDYRRYQNNTMSLLHVSNSEFDSKNYGRMGQQRSSSSYN
jgi:hypothetical protein